MDKCKPKRCQSETIATTHHEGCWQPPALDGRREEDGNWNEKVPISCTTSQETRLLTLTTLASMLQWRCALAGEVRTEIRKERHFWGNGCSLDNGTGSKRYGRAQAQIHHEDADDASLEGRFIICGDKGIFNIMPAQQASNVPEGRGEGSYAFFFTHEAVRARVCSLSIAEPWARSYALQCCTG
eukprot:4781905-Amphidinium_carterae.1